MKKISSRHAKQAADKAGRKAEDIHAPTRSSGIVRKDIWSRLFAIDPRSLAVFRMSLAVLLLADLAIRLSDLHAMYTDAGMFSRAEICRRVSTIWNWSFHFGSGSAHYEILLFAIAALLAVALLAGLETRLATIGSWLMLISVQHRVPPILSGADILLRLLLFWAMFLPLERQWSMDQWRQKPGTASTAAAPVLSMASAAILLQMALMYLFSAIFKTNLVWFRGEVIAETLVHDFFASPIGATLLQFPRFLKAMTWGTLLLEWTAPLLLFLPKWTPRLRMVLIAALAALHLGIGMCLEVDLFSPVALAGLTLFLPAEFWNSPMVARFSRLSQVVPQTSPASAPGLNQTERFSPVFNGLCAMLLLFIVALNIDSLPSQPLRALAPGKWKPLITAAGLGQKWNMFEDIPSKSGWYVALAKLKDGSEVDLLRNGAAVDWTKPSFPAGVYRNFRWRKLFREMAYDDDFGFQYFRQPVSEFLCRSWNARNPATRSIIEFDLVFCMGETAPPVGIPSLPTSRYERFVHLDLMGSEDYFAAGVER